jgi:putative transposase
MPRQARLDAPDTLHHGMVRGSERTATFRAAADRTAFLARVAVQAEQGAWTVSAGALLPHHAHLLVRTGTRPLARAMRSRLAGDAGTVNRRHHRGGPLLQNRSKSIGVEEAPYLRELVRYLHLNPLRATVVPALRKLDRYP